MRRFTALTLVMMALSPFKIFASSFPFIINVTASEMTTSSAVIGWTTAEVADSQVAYGTTSTYGSLTTLDPTMVRQHSQTLSGLLPNTQYYYQVMSTNTAGTLYVSGPFVFTTLPNIVPGMISDVNVSAVAESSATITWITNTPANSLVEYGLTTNYGASWGTTPLVTSHSLTLTNLAAGTLYHFRVKSADSNGNEGISGDFTFITAGGEQPNLSNISSFDTSQSAIITWTTSTPADSQVDYGPTASYGSSTPLDANLVTAHSVTLSQLVPNTLYHYRVRSTDAGGTRLVSSDFTFSTPAFTLYFPQINLAPNEYTGIAMANLDQSAATVNLTAFDGTGAKINGANVTNPATKVLGAGTQSAVMADQLFGPVQSAWTTGWTVINSSTTKLDGFSMAFDSAFSLMDGAAFSSSLLNTFVLPEASCQDYSRLLLANPNAIASSLIIELVKADGTVISTYQTGIPAFATYSADIQMEVFPRVVVDPSEYVRVTSSTPLLPYELFGNLSKDFSVVAGQDLNGGSTILYAPQYAVGGPYNSLLSIVNLDSTPGTVTLALLGGDGVQLGATKVLPIAGNGKIYISDPAFFLGSSPTQLTTGYVQVKSSGVRLSGDMVFSDTLYHTFSMALPLLTTLQQSQVLSHIASNAILFTGLAILNPNSVDTTVNLQTYTADGQLDNSLTQVIPAGNRISKLLTEYFPALAGQNRASGYIKLTADHGIACYGVFGTNNLSVLSAISAQPGP